MNTERLFVGFWCWVAWHLPKRLVYWATIRAGAHATSGRYGETVVPEVTYVTILNRWSKDKLGGWN